MNDEFAPVVGVYDGSDLAWENMPDDGIDLDYEDALESAATEELEYWEGGGTLLYGDWKLDNDGLYEPDSENSNAEFSLIYNSNEGTAQVVWSRFVRYGRPASLCYPGQVDAETDDPTEPEGAVGTVTIGDQFVATERRYVPYYALPEYVLREKE